MSVKPAIGGGTVSTLRIYSLQKCIRGTYDSTSTLLKSLMENETWLSAYSLGKNVTV